MAGAFRIVDRFMDLSDVDFSSFADGDLVRWDSDLGQFEGTPVSGADVVSALGYVPVSGPAGDDRQVQVNDGGDFGAVPVTITSSGSPEIPERTVGSGVAYRQNGNALIWQDEWENIGIGQSAIPNINTGLLGNSTVSIGQFSGNSVTTGNQNVFIGQFSGLGCVDGNGNVALGHQAYGGSASGHDNVAVGYRSMRLGNSGWHNVAVGAFALHVSTGEHNVAVGDAAGLISTGSRNVFIGKSAGGLATTASDKLYIANTNTEAPLIGGDFAAATVTITGQLTASGLLRAGSGPTTLTDAAGKILSAALNTVGFAQGGTGLVALGTALQQLRVNAGATALEYFTPTGATPGGSDAQVQFNDGGAFGGDAGLIYNKTSNVLTITSGGLVLATAGTITQTSNSSAAFESGPNGSTNPVFRLVNSVSSSATGLSVTGNAAGGGVTLSAISSGAGENINLVPLGNGGKVTITSGANGTSQLFVVSGILTSNTSIHSQVSLIWANGFATLGGGSGNLTWTVAGTSDITISPTASRTLFVTAAASAKVTDAGTDNVVNSLILGHASSNTPAAGFGAGILFNLKSSTTADRNAARIAAVWDIATDASRTADLVFYTVDGAAALTEAGRFKGAGQFAPAVGILPDSGGMKHARVTTGSVGAGSTALVTVTWTTEFADADYTVQASVLDSTTSSLSLSVVHVESITAAAVTVRVLNNSLGSLTGTLHVTAVHD